jgi:hypothetical protein
MWTCSEVMQMNYIFMIAGNYVLTPRSHTAPNILRWSMSLLQLAGHVASVGGRSENFRGRTCGGDKLQDQDWDGGGT